MEYDELRDEDLADWLADIFTGSPVYAILLTQNVDCDRTSETYGRALHFA